MCCRDAGSANNFLAHVFLLIGVFNDPPGAQGVGT
jgi:hypothetical protein